MATTAATGMRLRMAPAATATIMRGRRTVMRLRALRGCAVALPGGARRITVVVMRLLVTRLAKRPGRRLVAVIVLRLEAIPACLRSSKGMPAAGLRTSRIGVVRVHTQYWATRNAAIRLQ